MEKHLFSQPRSVKTKQLQHHFPQYLFFFYFGRRGGGVALGPCCASPLWRPDQRPYWALLVQLVRQWTVLRATSWLNRDHKKIARPDWRCFSTHETVCLTVLQKVQCRCPILPLCTPGSRTRIPGIPFGPDSWWRACPLASSSGLRLWTLGQSCSHPSCFSVKKKKQVPIPLITTESARTLLETDQKNERQMTYLEETHTFGTF